MRKLIIYIVAIVLCSCFPNIKSPQEMAKYSKCDRQTIAGWMGGAIQYREQSGYVPSSVVMERRWGDCKGFAVVANESLQACGIKSHIIRLTQKDGPGHAITVFTLEDGRKGFINAGQYRIYYKDIPWIDIISDVSGGPWIANFNEE